MLSPVMPELTIEYWKLKNANCCDELGGVTYHLKHRLHATGSSFGAKREPQRGSSPTDAGAATPLGLFLRSGGNPGWRCLAALVADPGLGALTPLASNRMLRAVESHSA